MIKKLKSEKAINNTTTLFLVDASIEDIQLFKVFVEDSYKINNEKVFGNLKNAEIEYDKVLVNFHKTFDVEVY